MFLCSFFVLFDLGCWFRQLQLLLDAELLKTKTKTSQHVNTVPLNHTHPHRCSSNAEDEMEQKTKGDCVISGTCSDFILPFFSTKRQNQ